MFRTSLALSSTEMRFSSWCEKRIEEWEFSTRGQSCKRCSIFTRCFQLIVYCWLTCSSRFYCRIPYGSEKRPEVHKGLIWRKSVFFHRLLERREERKKCSAFLKWDGNRWFFLLHQLAHKVHYLLSDLNEIPQDQLSDKNSNAFKGTSKAEQAEKCCQRLNRFDRKTHWMCFAFEIIFSVHFYGKK